MPSRSVDILVVEDNEGERESIVTALQAAIPNVRVIAFHHGMEALDFLFSRGEWTARLGVPPPKLILLDLSLSGSKGFFLLGQIRSVEQNSALTLTPVVIFTDSQAASDISECYRCGANSYITKPLSFPDFKAVVEIVGRYWVTHNLTAA